MDPADASSPASPAGPASPASPSGSPAPRETAGSAPGAAPATVPAPRRLDGLPLWLVPALFAGVLVLGSIATSVSPAFSEGVVWKYYWGPIQADAFGCGTETLYYGAPHLAAKGCPTGPGPHTIGVHSGYNIVNTASWAVLLGLCILFTAQLLSRLRTQMTGRLILGATAWVVVGSIFHVLEDTGLLKPPLQYVFITPPIYLLFAAFGILSLCIGHYLRFVARQAGTERALQKLWMLLVAPVMGYFLLWISAWPGIVAYVHPAWVALFAAVTFFVVRADVKRAGGIEPSAFVLNLSLGWFLLAAAYTVQYLHAPWADNPPHPDPAWPNILAYLLPGFAAATAITVGHRALRRTTPLRASAHAIATLVAGLAVSAAYLWFALPHRPAGQSAMPASPWPVTMAPLLAVLLVGLVFLVGRALRKANPDKPLGRALTDPINLLVVFAQLLDGFATALGIDLSGYSEKHVLSAGVIDWTRDTAANAGWDFVARHPTFFGFVPVKLAVSLLFVAVVDVGAHKEREEGRPGTHPNVIGLVKFAIIMVGLGPGIRDFLRLALGV